MKYPLIDLLPQIINGKIVVLVGESRDSGCSAEVHLCVSPNYTTSKSVSGLGRTKIQVEFDVPHLTGNMYSVVATIILDTNESNYDNAVMQF